MPAPAAEDIVLEPTAPHTATMIFMHGLGDTGMGWEDPMQMIQARIPGLKVILPTAPKIPVTLNGGMRMPAWYDIRGLGARSNETCDGIDASSQRIAEMLKAVRSADPSKKVFLGGFSQGGAMTLFTGLQHPEELAGLVVLSGYLACPQKVVGNAVQRKTIPIVMCHGDADPVVRLPWAEESKNGLEQAGFSIDFNVYPGLPHSPNAEVLRKVVSFLQSQL
eukprot:TRINITY_DN13245_c0_g1_i1.p1 TRINITY_DN13245_c0_g1~~TRINITY_DN13245_c0_g1_i1.p1  ORF type:complete len:255 (+),score=87.44 TRINITY_DN13245_c0_g1_i1:104-766(+)